MVSGVTRLFHFRKVRVEDEDEMVGVRKNSTGGLGQGGVIAYVGPVDPRHRKAAGAILAETCGVRRMRGRVWWGQVGCTHGVVSPMIHLKRGDACMGRDCAWTRLVGSSALEYTQVPAVEELEGLRFHQSGPRLGARLFLVMGWGYLPAREWSSSRRANREELSTCLLTRCNDMMAL